MNVTFFLPAPKGEAGETVSLEMAELPAIGSRMYFRDYDRSYKLTGNPLFVKDAYYSMTVLEYDPKQIETPGINDRFTELVEHFARDGRTILKISAGKLSVGWIRAEVVLAYEEEKS